MMTKGVRKELKRPKGAVIRGPIGGGFFLVWRTQKADTASPHGRGRLDLASSAPHCGRVMLPHALGPQSTEWDGGVVGLFFGGAVTH